MQTETVMIPFAQLAQSPFNVRSQRNEDSIKPLAASILTHRLIHNLVVHPLPGGKKKKPGFGVADGERRRSALALLHKDGKIEADYLVPCRVITVDDAVALSLAANVEREAMHPADELAGFLALHNAGKSAEEIAATYGVTPAVVTRRLKLANVAPRFFQMFREDKLSIEQMMALAQTDDHAKQEKVWNSLPTYDRDAHSLRAALTKDEIDAKRDRLARYVGLKAYEKAGGAVRRDLFSDDNDGYLQDAALLHQLAQEKLTRKQAEVAKEGWSWTETRLKFDYSDRSAFARVPNVRREPTKAEAKQLAKLEARVAALEEPDSNALDDEQQDELYELQEEKQELEARLLVPDPEGMTYAGAIITIDHHGQAEVFRGLVRPEDRKRITRDSHQTSHDLLDDGVDGCTEQPRGEFSEKLTRNLTAHVTSALQVGVARNPTVALAAILYPLVTRVLDIDRYGECITHVTPTQTRLNIAAPSIGETKAFGELQALTDSWRARVPSENVLDWLLQQSQADLLELLALCTAHSVDCIDGHGVSDDAKSLAKATRLDMAEWWQATSESFLTHVPKATIVQAVTEARSADVAAPLATLKKGDAVAAAVELLRDSRWVPSVMRL